MGDGTIFSNTNISILVILLIIYCVYKDQKDSYSAINWKDLNTIGEPIYEKPQDGYIDIEKQEAAYAADRRCRLKASIIQDGELNKKNPRLIVKNKGNAFVQGLTDGESFEDPHYSNRCDEISNTKRRSNFKNMVPRSSVNMYHKYHDGGY